jgi:hypothetical protein
MDDNAGEETELLYREAGGVCCRRAGSRICHSLLAIVFFLVMVVSFTSLGIFASKHNAIDGDLPKSAGHGNCILYTSKNQLSDGRLSHGDGCRFTIWGSGIVAMGGGLFLLGYLVKTATGTSLLTCLVCLELPLLLLLLSGSLAISINTTIGLAVACDGFSDYGTSGIVTAVGSCKNYTIVNHKFFEDVLISETLSWSVTGALLVVSVLFIIFTVVYCRGCAGSKNKSVSRRSEAENERIQAKWSAQSSSSSDQSSNPFL